MPDRSDNKAITLFHSNRYTAQSACEHCAGIVRHEPWCITIDPLVHYAYEIVVNPEKLTLADTLILHSLGVLWANPCQGNCKTSQMQLF